MLAVMHNQISKVSTGIWSAVTLLTFVVAVGRSVDASTGKMQLPELREAATSGQAFVAMALLISFLVNFYFFIEAFNVAKPKRSEAYKSPVGSQPAVATTLDTDKAIGFKSN